MAAFRPLSDVTVVDLSQFVPGPYGTCLLSDLGADVIKIEHPEDGDALRSLALEEDTESHSMNQYFKMLNRNKKSISINLKEDDGQKVFYRLVEEADVIVESFLPGVTERLLIDYETVREFNPDIIYCSVTGFGQTGPYKDVPGHDINFQAVAGVTSLSRSSSGKPNVPSTTYADLAGGAYVCISVLAALIQQETQYIDIAMTDILTTWTLPYIAQEFEEGVEAQRENNRHQVHPSYDFYETKDDKYLSIAAVEPKFWRGLCNALDIPNRIDDHQAADEETRNAVQTELADRFVTKTRDEWMQFFSGKDLPVTPVQTLDEIEESDYVTERELIVSGEGYGKQFRFPTLFTDGVSEFSRAPPGHGEQTTEILTDIGLTDSEIDRLKQNNTI